jgi:hypothetical protein
MKKIVQSILLLSLFMLLTAYNATAIFTAGSTVTTSVANYCPSTSSQTITFPITVSASSPDAEYIDFVSVSAPAGISIAHLTPLNPAAGTVSCASGDGEYFGVGTQTVSWAISATSFVTPSGCGFWELLGSITSKTYTVALTIPANYNSPIAIGYNVNGDGWQCTGACNCGIRSCLSGSFTINPFTVTASVSAPNICLGSSTTFTGGGASTYTWSDGTNTPTDAIAFTPLTTGTSTYTVTGTDANLCSATATVTLTINALPTITAAVAATPICLGSSATFTGGGASTYTWSDGTNTPSDAIAFTPLTAGTSTYTVTGTDANLCSATATVSVTVNPAAATPTVSATPNSICAGGNSDLNAVSIGNTINWYDALTAGTLLTTLPSATNYNVAPAITTTYFAEAVTPAGGTQTFSYIGSAQTFIVPAGITSIDMECWGAQGGANWVNNTNFGGYSKGTIAVTPGETLTIYVGNQPTTIAGGFNGGGAGDGAGRAGGGSSDVRQGGTSLNDRIIVAGGGGGAGYWSGLHVAGGGGGGANLSGGDGYREPSFVTNPGGLGATVLAAGANGTCSSFNNPNMAGAFGLGGSPATFSCGCEGYGGGGGWYGGAGSGNCRGAGGGSGYVISTATNLIATSGIRIGDGQVTLTWTGLGCTSASRTPVIVSVNPLPTVTASVSTTPICLGASTTFTGGGASTYSWSDGTNTPTDATAFTPLTVSNSTYTVTGTDANLCSATSSIAVNVTQPATFNAPTTLLTSCSTNTGGSVIVSASGPSTYSISPIGPTQPSSGVFTSMVGGTNYVVTLTDANLCTNTISISATSVSNGELANAAATNASSIAGNSCGILTQTDSSTLNYFGASCDDLIATVVDASGGNVLGDVNACVTVLPTVPTFNSQPYLPRYYDITPTNQGPAIITLYFTQDDFDDYNAAAGAFPQIPAVQATGTASFSISQVPGGFLSGASGATTIVHNVTATWNTTLNRWEVTFPVASFSGFYAHATNPLNSALPAAITNFKGTKTETTDLLTWTTTSELNNASFNILYSTDGKNFNRLTSVNSKATNGNSNVVLNYSAENSMPKLGHNYYKLEQVDIDGKSLVNSQVVDLMWGTNGSTISVYPNPTSNELNIDIYTTKAENATVKVLDMSGRILKEIHTKLVVGANSIQTNIGELASGIYTVQILENNKITQVSKVEKK